MTQDILNHMREVIPKLFNARYAKKMLALTDDQLMSLAPHILSLEKKMKDRVTILETAPELMSLQEILKQEKDEHG